MRKTVLVFILALVFLFSACGGGTKNSTSGSAPPSLNDNGNDYKEGYDSGESQADNSQGNVTRQSQQLIIVNYSLNVECEDVGKAIEKIMDKCDESGGYVESQESSQYNAYMVLRIPSKSGQDIIDFINDSFYVKRSQKSTKDITDNYVDNDARLTNLKAEEAQILEVMKKASTVEDILKVQSRLYDVRAEIESLEALKKSWDNQVQYSTIAISLSQKAIVTETKRSIISGSDFLKAIKNGFSNTAIGLALFLQRLVIFIISNILVLIILAGAIYGAVRIYKRRTNRNHKGSPEPEK